MFWARVRWHVRYRLKTRVNAAAGPLALWLLGVFRRRDRVAASNLAAALMRTVGPLLPEHRVGRANLRAAFPAKSSAEIDAILRGVWDNLGRVAVEFAHLGDLCAGDPWRRTNIDYTPDNIARFLHLRDDGLPALVFAAHLANWELPAIIGALDGVPSAVLYRRPNVGALADALIAERRAVMGDLIPSGLGAPLAMARALGEGKHVGMLVDQHEDRGVEVTFFGRKCRANPLIAMLARQIPCPIYGGRIIRLPGGRFQAEITEPLAPVRDAAGRVDVAGTMQMITSVVEGWVREHPEQWLWVHRRWR